MPFVVEQVVEQDIDSSKSVGNDPTFAVIVISVLLIYFFRNIVFGLLKIGFIAFLAFTLFKFIT